MAGTDPHDVQVSINALISASRIVVKQTQKCNLDKNKIMLATKTDI